MKRTVTGTANDSLFGFISHTNVNFRYSNFSVNSVGYEKPSEYKLRQLLKELRISAEIHQIPEWTRNEEFTRNSSVLKQFTENRSNGDSPVTEENINRSKLYMQK